MWSTNNLLGWIPIFVIISSVLESRTKFYRFDAKRFGQRGNIKFIFTNLESYTVVQFYLL